MEDIFGKWLTLFRLKATGLPVPAESKGWVTINFAHAFIGSGGFGAVGGWGSGGYISEELKTVKPSPEKFATPIDGAIKKSDHAADVNHYSAQEIKDQKMKAFSANRGEHGGKRTRPAQRAKSRRSGRVLGVATW